MPKSPRSQVRRPRKTLLERFMLHVDTSHGCWLWTAARNAKGYGQIRVWSKDRWKNIPATHVAWLLAHGEWPPKDKLVLHACDVPSCVKPSHLWIGTAIDNRHDAILKGRQAGLRPEQITYAMSSNASQRSIAKKLGVNQSTISKIRGRHAEEAAEESH